MRLWHQKMIDRLPRNQLLGQHRECCALRGKGWGKKHSIVDYVFNYSPYYLYKYHLLVMEEMESRGYKVSSEWKNKNYRGKNMAEYDELEECETPLVIYKEHDENYMVECMKNLKNKGIYFEF